MKTPTLADKLDELARHLDFIPPMDATADTITEVDEFYKGCALAILATVGRCEQMLDAITDPDTRRRTAAALTGVRRVLADVAALTPRSRETGFTLDPRAGWYREFPRAAKRFYNPEPSDFAAITTAKAPARLTVQVECHQLWERVIAVDEYANCSPGKAWDQMMQSGMVMPCTREAFITAVNRERRRLHGPQRARKADKRKRR